MRALPANPKQYSGLPVEQRAAIRHCLNEVITLRIGDETHVTTYGALETFIGRAFFEGHSLIYDDQGRVIAMHYGRCHGYAPQLAAVYVTKLVRGGHLDQRQISAFTGIPYNQIQSRYKRKKELEHASH